MTGDFNNHHGTWYAALAADTRIHNNIRNNKQHANVLVNYVEHHALILQNTHGIFTYFPPVVGKKEPTTIDLTFTRGHATTIAQAWSCDRGTGGTLDHAVTTTSLACGPPPFIAHCIFGLTNWNKFEEVL